MIAGPTVSSPERCTTAARDAGVALRPTHFANDVTLTVFALDDLLPSATSAG